MYDTDAEEAIRRAEMDAVPGESAGQPTMTDEEMQAALGHLGSRLEAIARQEEYAMLSKVASALLCAAAADKLMTRDDVAEDQDVRQYNSNLVDACWDTAALFVSRARKEFKRIVTPDQVS